MCARRKQSVIIKIDRTMNYFLLAETDFFRLINEAGDCNMETAYTAFATQVIELCNGCLLYTSNRFVVEGNYKYTYNNGHLAMADPLAAARNFLNAMEMCIRDSP